jgi:hypothetical protein
MLAQAVSATKTPADIPAAMAKELSEMFVVLESRARYLPLVAPDLPFSLFALYNRDEIVAPFRDNPRAMMAGTFYSERYGLDVHLFTLDKSGGFTRTTTYQDWFEAPDRIHWESQSTTTATCNTGKRLIGGLGRHLFFVRESKQDPFMCIGFGSPISSEGECPIRLRWKLEHSVPDHDYVRFLAAAG